MASSTAPPSPCPGLVLVRTAARLLLRLGLGLTAFLFACTPAATPTPAPPPTPTPTLVATPRPTATATPRPTPTPTPTPDPAAVIRDLASIAAEVRGLAPKAEVSQVFLPDEELAERIRERIAEDLDPAELETTRRVLVLLDLLAPGVDLRQLLVDLYGDLVLGYYDPEDKELVVRQQSGSLGPSEKVTFVHEFTHALQDQHFDLHGTRAALRELGDSEREAAHVALVEGDAVLAESIYLFEYLTEEERFLLLFGAGSGETSALDGVPEYIRRTLYFPYLEGFQFVFHLYNQGGWDAVNAAYERPPLSTSHILHPQKYLEGQEPVSVDLGAPEQGLGESWETLRTDVLGEFSLYLHLDVYLEEAEARRAAEGWRGDRFTLFANDAQEDLFVLLTHWDDAAEASEFFDSYAAFIGAKSGGAWSMQQAPFRRQWQTAQGREVLLQQDGDTVLLVLAPHASAALQAERVLRG